MKKFFHNIVVRYAETDQMGVVYYANYFVYFESARSDFLRKLGIPYKELEKNDIYLPVIEAFAKYISPAFYEDELIVELWLEEIKYVSIKIAYNIKRKNDEKLLVQGWTKHAVINKNLKPVKIPDYIKEKLKEYSL